VKNTINGAPEATVSPDAATASYQSEGDGIDFDDINVERVG
jgi:hypothetical protein